MRERGEGREASNSMQNDVNDAEEYRGYRIVPGPLELSGPRRWSVEVQIERHTGREVLVKKYGSGSISVRIE